MLCLVLELYAQKKGPSSKVIIHREMRDPISGEGEEGESHVMSHVNHGEEETENKWIIGG